VKILLRCGALALVALLGCGCEKSPARGTGSESAIRRLVDNTNTCSDYLRQKEASKEILIQQEYDVVRYSEAHDEFPYVGPIPVPSSSPLLPSQLRAMAISANAVCAAVPRDAWDATIGAAMLGNRIRP
jgi:hypothetical protein